MPATKGHGIVSGMSSSCHWFSIIKIMSDVQLLILNKEPGEGFSQVWDTYSQAIIGELLIFAYSTRVTVQMREIIYKLVLVP